MQAIKNLLKYTDLFILLFALQPAFTESQISGLPLSDPYIPNGESSSYLAVNKKGTVIVRQTVIMDKSGKLYRIVVKAPLITRELTLNRKTMTPVELIIITRNDNYMLTTRRSVKYSHKNGKSTSADPSSTLSEKGTPEMSTLTLLSASDIPYVLRGFPFETPIPVEIKFLNDQGTGDDDAPFKVTAETAGEETLSVAGRQIPCYVLEIKYHISGFMSFFKSMLPKTKLWYSKEFSHYLVKYENKGGRGNAGNMVMTLTEYNGWR